MTGPFVPMSTRLDELEAEVSSLRGELASMKEAHESLNARMDSAEAGLLETIKASELESEQLRGKVAILRDRLARHHHHDSGGRAIRCAICLPELP